MIRRVFIFQATATLQARQSL